MVPTRADSVDPRGAVPEMGGMVVVGAAVLIAAIFEASGAGSLVFSRLQEAQIQDRLGFVVVLWTVAVARQGRTEPGVATQIQSDSAPISFARI